jgi:hypothetical protein
MGSKIGCGNAFPLVRGVPVFQNAYRSFALLSGLFLFFIFGASAQTSSINATVTDATGAVVPGAKVTVQDAARNSTRTATTSGAGVYSIADLPPSVYDVTVEKEGFRSQQFAAVKLTVDQAPHA